MIPVVILAGGKGTRLGTLAADIPKPMVPVMGRPLLEWQFDLARRHGAPSVTVFAGHKAEVIADRYHGTSWDGMNLRVVIESAPLGTAGAVLAEYDRLPDEFFVLYGDTMTNVDLTRMLAHHRTKGPDATLYVHPNDHPHDSDLIECDASGWIRAVHGYPHPDGAWYRNLVNAALYVFTKASLAPWAGKEVRCDFAKHLIPEMLGAGCRVAAYRGYDYIKDMGTPERLTRVEEDIRHGVLELKRSSRPRTAVFVDRDGTLIEERNHLADPGQVALLDGVPAAVRRLNRASAPVIVVTNQPVVARGEATPETIDAIHGRIDTLLGEGGAFVDEWFYCPHHPDRGFPGEVPELKRECDCRKPNPGMIEAAAGVAPVRLEDSWLIGDTSTDLLAARQAGLRSVLVRTGYAGCDGKHAVRADYTFPSLPFAVDFILDEHHRLRSRADAVAADHGEARLVVLAGPAHGGKSTFASVLAEAYRGRGLDCVSICLDGFIRPPEERGEDFESRHDLEGVEMLLNRIATQREDLVRLELPIYDRRSRGPFPEPERLELAADTVVVVEGVSASRIEGIAGLADAFLWIACDAETRRQRFIRDYRWRGMSADEIDALWEARMIDEASMAPTEAHAVDLSSPDEPDENP